MLSGGNGALNGGMFTVIMVSRHTNASQTQTAYFRWLRLFVLKQTQSSRFKNLCHREMGAQGLGAELRS